MKKVVDAESGQNFSKDLGLAYSLTLIVAVLLTIASAGSLLFPGSIYPEEEQRVAFLTNDVINLLICIPMLTLTLALVRRGRLVGVVLWPGALMYVVYNYLAYIFGMPLSWTTAVNSLLVILGLTAGVILLRKLDLSGIAGALAGVGPRMVAVILIVVFGLGFFSQAVQEVAGYISGARGITLSDFGVFVADLVVSVIWIVGGVLLFVQKPMGYVLGWGGMFGVVMLNIGLLLYLVLQPGLTGTPFDLVGIVVIAVFTIVCTLPFALFLRSLRRSETNLL